LAHRVLARLEAEHVLEAQGTGPRRRRRVTNPAALLDLWAEEAAAERPQRTLAHIVARTPEARMRTVAENLEHMEIPYAITGAAAAALLAPMVTAIPTTEVWVSATFLPAVALEAAGADPVDQGANIVLLQAKDDTPLAFARRHEDVVIANTCRLYADLRRDPRRGREQAENLRHEVIGF